VTIAGRRAAQKFTPSGQWFLARTMKNSTKIISFSKISRRKLLETGCQGLSYLLLGNSLTSCRDNPLFCKSRDDYFIKPAKYWHRLKGGTVQCDLCPNQCQIDRGNRGFCRTRENIDGRLYTIIYSRIAASHLDPIEKKPLFHFLPGSMTYSVATAGCNFTCKFCQNWQLSQASPEDLDAVELSPSSIIKKTTSLGSKIIAYTYNEPIMQYEYIIDSSSIARKKGIKSVIISNGYIRSNPSRELASMLDAIKVDLKAFTNKFYSSICGGDLNSVLKNLETVHSTGTWLELVVLVIPTLNDSPGEIKKMASWVQKNLSRDIPMHFTRFHSMYKIRNLPPTPVNTLERCRTIAMDQGIRYAYVGNVPGHRWENTYCHKCKRKIINRSGYFHVVNKIKNSRCPYCGSTIPGIWS